MESPFAPEYHDAWKKLDNQLAPDRPTVGKRVQVAQGRHKGFEGVVFWHGPDRFYDCTRYMNDAQLFLHELTGRTGYRVGIKGDDDRKIFVNADYVIVLDQGPNS